MQLIYSVNVKLSLIYISCNYEYMMIKLKTKDNYGECCCCCCLSLCLWKSSQQLCGRITKKSVALVVVVLWACVYGRASNRSCRSTPISLESEQESTTHSKSYNYKTLCFPRTKKPDHSKSDNYITGRSDSDNCKMLDCPVLTFLSVTSESGKSML